MTGILSNSPESNYLTRSNIVVPKRAAGGPPPAMVGTVGEKNLEDRLADSNTAVMAGRRIDNATAVTNITVVESLKGVAATTNEIQTILVPPATSGTFTLTFGANTTAPLPANETAANVQVALRALASVGGANLTVADGPVAGSYVVTFIGTLAQTDVAMISGNGTALVNAPTPTQES